MEGADEVVKDVESFGCGRHGDAVVGIMKVVRGCTLQVADKVL